MQPAATVAVSGLVVFGTFTSLAAKIGVQALADTPSRDPEILLI